MRTTLSALGLAIVCSVALGAQGAGTPDQPGKKPDAPITVVGCVATATEPGQFQLTNAMMASPMGQEKMSDKAKAAAGDTYMLSGGELKPHVGHKVEVTGTLTPAKGQAGEKPPAAGEKPAAPSAMTRGTLAVTAVKMVSATCP